LLALQQPDKAGADASKASDADPQGFRHEVYPEQRWRREVAAFCPIWPRRSRNRAFG
jgi:hypothetical protein